MSKNPRLFFALWPTDAVRAELAAAAPSYSCLGRAIAARNLHITLVFLGSVAQARRMVARRHGQKTGHVGVGELAPFGIGVEDALQRGDQAGAGA